MSAPHYTVKIEIHRVEHVNTTNTPVCRCVNTSSCNHARPKYERDATQIVNVVTRVDEPGDNGLRMAIDKAVRHLDCERPAERTLPL